MVSCRWVDTCRRDQHKNNYSMASVIDSNQNQVSSFSTFFENLAAITTCSDAYIYPDVAVFVPMQDAG